VAEPRTRITTVATGSPGVAYEVLYRAAKEYGGTFVSVRDEDAFRAMHIMAKMDGVSMEAAAAMACAAAIQMVREGIIQPHETVVINCSGHTFPVEKHLLDEDWTHDLDLSHETLTVATAPSEGILQSLEGLSQTIRRVAILEDDPASALLVRRILQAQGNYGILEANDGVSGMELIRREKPDLVLLDLMMPGIDGFTVVEQMKADPALHEIPIIVITAATLTAHEKARLKGKVRATLRKGSFVDTELIEVVER
jgi:threonine synthase